MCVHRAWVAEDLNSVLQLVGDRGNQTIVSCFCIDLDSNVAPSRIAIDIRHARPNPPVRAQAELNDNELIRQFYLGV